MYTKCKIDIFPEFTINSWILIGSSNIVLLGIVITVNHALVKFNIAKQRNILFKIWETSMDLCCKALLNKSVVIYLNSKTYKMLALTITTLSFIILTYYKTQMNAALNVHIEKFPINNWDEAYSKDFNIIFYFGSYTESILKNSPGLQKLYEKVMSSHYTKDLGSIGVKTSVKEILKGYTIAVEEASVYKYLDIYPCEITELKSMR